MYATLMGMSVRRWNKSFDQDIQTQFNKEKSLLWRKARVVQQLIRDTTGTDQEDVV